MVFVFVGMRDLNLNRTVELVQASCRKNSGQGENRNNQKFDDHLHPSFKTYKIEHFNCLLSSAIIRTYGRCKVRRKY